MLYIHYNKMQYTYVFFDPNSAEGFFLYVGNADFYEVMTTWKALREKEKVDNYDEDFDIYEELRQELHCYYSPLNVTNIETGKIMEDFSCLNN